MGIRCSKCGVPKSYYDIADQEYLINRNTTDAMPSLRNNCRYHNIYSVLGEDEVVCADCHKTNNLASNCYHKWKWSWIC